MRNWRRWIVPLFLVAIVMVLWHAGVAMADDKAPAPEGGDGKVTVWFLFKQTGIVGMVILLLSIIGTALAIQYGMEIREQNILPPYLVEEVEHLVEDGEYEEAATLCEKGDSYYAKILFAGFQAVGLGGADAPIEAMETVAVEETFKLNAKISYINLIGNLGPLVGLLGTVTGMISSFQTIATKKSPTPKDLAEGVYESLVNTTMGLAIALAFLTVFFIFKNKISKMTLMGNTFAHDVLKRVSSQ
jgi:biopolymer transport protein ExbB